MLSRLHGQQMRKRRQDEPGAFGAGHDEQPVSGRAVPVAHGRAARVSPGAPPVVILQGALTGPESRGGEKG